MQNHERRRDAKLLKVYQQRIKAAREGKSSIPGPKEAKKCMQAIEKKHLLNERLRLQVFRLRRFCGIYVYFSSRLYFFRNIIST